MGTLYRINHDLPSKLWCGLAALAAVTGHPTSRCRDALKAGREARGWGKVPVMSVHMGELPRALERLGFRGTWTEIPRPDGKLPTLNQWARARCRMARDGIFIVATASHYIVVAGRRFVDNANPDPVWLTDAPYRRARVHGALRVLRA